MVRRLKCFTLLLAFGSVIPAAAVAHNHWIGNGGYRNPVSKEWCCGKDDCFVVAPETVSLTTNGYRLSATSETVPFSETLRSEDGQYWRCQLPDGRRRCFFAPDLGS